MAFPEDAPDKGSRIQSWKPPSRWRLISFTLLENSFRNPRLPSGPASGKVRAKCRACSRSSQNHRSRRAFPEAQASGLSPMFMEPTGKHVPRVVLQSPREPFSGAGKGARPGDSTAWVTAPDNLEYIRPGGSKRLNAPPWETRRPLGRKCLAGGSAHPTAQLFLVSAMETHRIVLPQTFHVQTRLFLSIKSAVPIFKKYFY